MQDYNPMQQGFFTNITQIVAHTNNSRYKINTPTESYVRWGQPLKYENLLQSYYSRVRHAALGPLAVRFPAVVASAKNSSAGEQPSTVNLVSFDDHTLVKLPSPSSTASKANDRVTHIARKIGLLTLNKKSAIFAR